MVVRLLICFLIRIKEQDVLLVRDQRRCRTKWLRHDRRQGRLDGRTFAERLVGQLRPLVGVSWREGSAERRCWRLLGDRHGSGRGTFIGPRPLRLVSLLALDGGAEVADWWHLWALLAALPGWGVVTGAFIGAWLLVMGARGSSRCCCFGQELFEVLEEIRRCMEQGGHLRIHVLDRLLLSLICTCKISRNLVYLGLILKRFCKVGQPSGGFNLSGE